MEATRKKKTFQTRKRNLRFSFFFFFFFFVDFRYRVTNFFFCASPSPSKYLGFLSKLGSFLFHVRRHPMKENRFQRFRNFTMTASSGICSLLPIDKFSMEIPLFLFPRWNSVEADGLYWKVFVNEALHLFRYQKR